MSGRKACWIECDICLVGDVAQHPLNLGASTIADARADAQAHGWIFRRGQDICPQCARDLRIVK